MTRYCIIGAGAAGLASLKTLLEHGHAVDCFERGDQLGGHWNTDYDFLHLITSSRVTHFEGYPMPQEWPLFPSRDHVLEYLRRYAEDFDLERHITLGIEVTAVTPVASDGPTGSAGWEVTTSDGVVRTYDGVLVANGHLWDPRIPDVPGEFTGTQVHSGQYRNVDDITGRRVLVVGSGNSGCDLAVDAAQHGYDTQIVIRRGHYFQPKTYFGKPRSELTWMQEFSFEEQDLLARILIRVSKGTAAEYPGLPEPDHRTLAEGPPIVNELLLYWIQHGRISVRPGIERFEGTTVHFSDGTSGEFDTILWATGFHASLPFLDESLLRREDGVPLRVGAAVVPLDLDKLYLIGLIAPRGPQLPIYPTQAAIAARMIALHEAEPGGFRAIAGPLTAAQQPLSGIDMLPPRWVEEVQRTHMALDLLGAEVPSRV